MRNCWTMFLFTKTLSSHSSHPGRRCRRWLGGQGAFLGRVSKSKFLAGIKMKMDQGSFRIFQDARFEGCWWELVRNLILFGSVYVGPKWKGNLFIILFRQDVFKGSPLAAPIQQQLADSSFKNDFGRFPIICTNCIHCIYFAFNCPMACKFAWHAMSGRPFRLTVWRIKVGSSWIHVAILAPLLPLLPLLHDSPPMSRSWLASMRMIPTTLQPSRSLADPFRVKKTMWCHGIPHMGPAWCKFI